MVNLALHIRPRTLAAAWHGPDKHRVRFIASVAVLSFLLLIGAATVVWGKETLLEMWPQKPVAAAQVPALTQEQQELLDITRAPTDAAVTDADQARKINAGLPFSSAPVLAARPFNLTPVDAQDRVRAVECLAQAVYYEAAYEPMEGRRAVAQVVLNRVRHPAFPKTVCGVVFEGAPSSGCQFSFACDGAMARTPAPALYAEARKVAEAALNGYVMKAVGEATHYHADYVSPYWAPKLAKVKQLGAHIFYRWPGGWGEPAAFNGRYAGLERPFTFGKAQQPAPVLAMVEAPKPSAKVEDPTDRRAPNDVGGRLDPEKGWTLQIQLPTETRSSLSTITAQQGEPG